MIVEGVDVKRLTRYPDQRGFFSEVVRASEGIAIKQISLTMSYPGVIKAFHAHKYQDDLWLVVSGNALVVTHDLREGSPTFGQTGKVVLGEVNPATIYIPAGVAHGYKVLGNKPMSMIYATTNEYDRENPDEERYPYDEFYDWELKYE